MTSSLHASDTINNNAFTITRRKRGMQKATAQHLSDEHIIATVGEVIPSDVTFVDYAFSSSKDGKFDLSQVYLYSDQERKFSSENKTFSITYNHALRYRGEVVWQLQTTCHGNREGVYGESSTCHLSDSSLRVRIREKLGPITVSPSNCGHSNNRSSWNTSCKLAPGALLPTRTSYTKKLTDILHQSAEAYQQRFGIVS